MTGNLSPKPMKLQGVPATCPKCGQEIVAQSPANLVAHLFRVHRPSHAIAMPKTDPLRSREFFYVGPVPGTTSPIWHVVYVDWPYEVARLDLARFSVSWMDGNGPKETT